MASGGEGLEAVSGFDTDAMELAIDAMRTDRISCESDRSSFEFERDFCEQAARR